MSSASAGSRLALLLTPVVQQTGLELEAVAVTLARDSGKQGEAPSTGRRSQVRVLVDKDGGVSLDDVALVSQAISAALDSTAEADAVLGPAAYVLEVSSPGVDRPLSEPRHWRRAHGRLVRATLAAGGEVTGRIVDVDQDGVRLLVPGPRGRPAGEQSYRFGELGPGRVQVEFTHRSASDEPVDDADDGNLDAHGGSHGEESR
jgi:ribosome maturation factor RimP